MTTRLDNQKTDLQCLLPLCDVVNKNIDHIVLYIADKRFYQKVHKHQKLLDAIKYNPRQSHKKALNRNHHQTHLTTDAPEGLVFNRIDLISPTNGADTNAVRHCP